MLRVLKQSISVVQYPVTNTTEETDTGLVGDACKGNSKGGGGEGEGETRVGAVEL